MATHWYTVALVCLLARCVRETSSAPSSAAAGNCPEERRQAWGSPGCEPDLTIGTDSSYTLVKSSTGDGSVTLFVRPGQGFDSLNVTLGLAKLSAMPEDVDTLPEHLWDGVKNWLFSGPLEKVREGVSNLLSSVSSKFSDLTEGSHTQVLSARDLSLTDACRWYNLTVEALRNDRSGPDNWGLRVWVEGAPSLYTTKYWWHINWIMFVEVSAKGSSQWVTTRDTVCRSGLWVVVGVGVGVVLLLATVAVILCCCVCRKRCRVCVGGDEGEVQPLGPSLGGEEGPRSVLGLYRVVTGSAKRWVLFKVTRGQDATGRGGA
ncbi:uncharacterized protein [Panulirus ornatus]|uniref:uncharacterized protein n=1 Tax=Panulirus ornatus TaxID=150431 RepID=UPI003A845B80